jgi:hypothetical protein
MIAGSVHDVLTEFPQWKGVKIVVALSQGTPWLLVVRTDLAAKPGDLNAVKGLRLTAAEGPDLALKQMLIGAGIDPAKDLRLVELPGAKARNVSFGVSLRAPSKRDKSTAFGPTPWAAKPRSAAAPAKFSLTCAGGTIRRKCAALRLRAWLQPTNS